MLFSDFEALAKQLADHGEVRSRTIEENLKGTEQHVQRGDGQR